MLKQAVDRRIEGAVDEVAGPDGFLRRFDLGVDADRLHAFDGEVDGIDPVGPGAGDDDREGDLGTVGIVAETVAVLVLVARLVEQGLGGVGIIGCELAEVGLDGWVRPALVELAHQAGVFVQRRIAVAKRRRSSSCGRAPSRRRGGTSGR